MVLAHVSRNKISASRRRGGRTAVATVTLREPSSAGGAGTGCVGDSAAGIAPGRTSGSGDFVGSSGTVDSSGPTAHALCVAPRAHENFGKTAEFAPVQPGIDKGTRARGEALAHFEIVAGSRFNR